MLVSFQPNTKFELKTVQSIGYWQNESEAGKRYVASISTVISSSNEDSDFSRNQQKITKHKKQ